MDETPTGSRMATYEVKRAMEDSWRVMEAALKEAALKAIAISTTSSFPVPVSR